ncbi:cytochrome P450 [Ceratobasidium sp. AG-I]|nr:cytochrome P450 [Ceratobasidium sp. AG-I]
MDSILSNLSPTTWLALGVCVSLAVYPLTRTNKLAVRLPGPPDGTWTTGHFRQLFGIGAVEFQENLVSTYGTTVKLNGAFGEEFIYTLDPAIMHAVLVKERANFERPLGGTLFIRAAFGGGLLGQTGEEHRMHRKVNTTSWPSFLANLSCFCVNMPVFMDIAQQTCNSIEKDLAGAKEAKDMDIFPWMTSAALELVGEAGLGYSFQSFTGQRNRYKLAIRDVLTLFSRSGPFMKFLPYVHDLGTPTLRQWVLRYNPIKMVRRFVEAVSIQNAQAEEALRARQELISAGVDLSSEPGRGRDIMTLLMKANEAEGSENHIDRQAMIGHMNVFIFAGHETTSTAIARILDVLAQNSEVQTKLREEVNAYFKEHQDNSDHDDLLELPYLDAIIRETLRMYGPVTGVSRANLEDTVLPLEYPIETPEGKITSIPIKKGTRVAMSIVMANRYEKTWGERSHEFWPERWIGHKPDEVTEPGCRLEEDQRPACAVLLVSNNYQDANELSPVRGNGNQLSYFKVMVAALVRKFKFEPSEEESGWAAFGIQFPYLKKEENIPNRLPKLPLKLCAPLRLPKCELRLVIESSLER